MGIANQNLLPSQQAAVAGVINPASTAAGTVTSGWVSMTTFAALQAILITGTLGTAATVDAKIQQATDAAGSGVKDIAGKAITQLTKAADDNKQAVINVTEADLDVANNFTHVRVSMTVATATSVVGAIIMGHLPHYGPASDNDASTVAEIIE